MKKLFIVDTDKEFQGIVGPLCPPDSVDVQFYSSSIALFSLIEKERPDLIFLALEIPDLNDFVMYDLLKRTTVNYSIPVLITYSDQSENELEQYEKLKFKAEGYYKKPIPEKDLKRLLANYLDLEINSQIGISIDLEQEDEKEKEPMAETKVELSVEFEEEESQSEMETPFLADRGEETDEHVDIDEFLVDFNPAEEIGTADTADEKIGRVQEAFQEQEPFKTQVRQPFPDQEEEPFQGQVQIEELEQEHEQTTKSEEKEKDVDIDEFLVDFNPAEVMEAEDTVEEEGNVNLVQEPFPAQDREQDQQPFPDQVQEPFSPQARDPFPEQIQGPFPDQEDEEPFLDHSREPFPEPFPDHEEEPFQGQVQLEEEDTVEDQRAKTGEDVDIDEFLEDLRREKERKARDAAPKKEERKIDNELANQVISLESQNEFLRSENKELTGSVKALRDEIKERNAAIEQLKIELGNKAAESSTEKERLISELENKVAGESAEKDHLISELEKKIAEGSGERERLKTELERKTAEYETLANKLEDEKKQIEANFRNEIEALKEESRKVESEKEELQKQMDSINQTVSALTEEKIALAERIASLKDNMSNWQGKIEEKEAVHQSAIDDFKKELDESRSKINFYKNRIDQLEENLYKVDFYKKRLQELGDILQRAHSLTRVDGQNKQPTASHD